MTMRTRLVAVGVLALATAIPSFAQEGARQRWPDRGSRGGGQARPATPEGGSTRSRGDDGNGGGRRAEPRGTQGDGRREGTGGRARGLPRQNGADFAEQERERQRAAEPRLRRPEDGNRQAVPRPVAPPRFDNGRRYGEPPRAFSNRNPRRYRSYGGYTGPSYFFYYDPFYRYPDRSFLWYGDYGGYGFGYPTGELRLDVSPQQAEVYVDGYYAGQVDDFDGFAQGLRLEEGPYHIEIMADGYEPLAFDVRIQRGRRISYAGDLMPEPYGY